MYYGCTATGHSEHTCLSAYYCGPKRFKNLAAWCESCRTTYKHPEEGDDAQDDLSDVLPVPGPELDSTGSEPAEV